jgi:nucleolar protein 56
LGAEKAFFNHLKTGAPPPKHGHIFMHPWVSRSPKWIRGKISRTLSAKISIAAKIDAFEGTAWTEEDVKLVENRIEEIRANFPTPQSRLQR